MLIPAPATFVRSLTSRTSVKDVFVSDFQNLKDLRANTSISQDDRRSKIEEIRRKQREELLAILTANQQAEWKKELDMRREAFGALFN